MQLKYEAVAMSMQLKYEAVAMSMQLKYEAVTYLYALANKNVEPHS